MDDASAFPTPTAGNASAAKKSASHHRLLMNTFIDPLASALLSIDSISAQRRQIQPRLSCYLDFHCILWAIDLNERADINRRQALPADGMIASRADDDLGGPLSRHSRGPPGLSRGLPGHQ
jgi:hypothetical protein